MKGVTAFFRVDEAATVGSGHFVRCTSLAIALKKRGVKIHFICASVSPKSIKRVSDLGFGLSVILEGATRCPTKLDVTADAYATLAAIDKFSPEKSLLIIDHYSIDATWHKILRPHIKKIVVIDDLNNRQYDCDMLLDQTYNKLEEDYRPWVNPGTLLCIGSHYMLVRDDFRERRSLSIERRDSLMHASNILITMGGADSHNATGRVIQAIKAIGYYLDISVNIVLGGLCPHRSAIENAVKTLDVARTKVLVDVDYMAELMAESDLCISAAGSTLWECATLGVPVLAYTTADNQQTIAKNLSDELAINYPGDFNDQTITRLSEQIKRAISDSAQLQKLSEEIRRICTGDGTTRVVDSIDSLWEAQC